MTGPSVPRVPSPRRLGSNRNHTGSNLHHSATATAWDVPPAIASPSTGVSTPAGTSAPSTSLWKPRKSFWKSPHRLASIVIPNEGIHETATDTWNSSFSCSPLLWKQKYLVISMLSGDILIFGDLLQELSTTSLSTSSEKFRSPLAVLNLATDSAIVGILPLGDNSSSGSSQTSTLIALTLNGQIHRLSFRSKKDGTTSSEEDMTIAPQKLDNKNLLRANVPQTSHCELVLEASFSTGQCGASCMALCKEECLLVGYDSGHVESWKFVWEKPKKRPKLLFRGWVEEHMSVNAIGVLARSEYNESDAGEEKVKEKASQAKLHTEQPIVDIILTLQPRIGGDPPFVRVLDLCRIEAEAKKFTTPLVRSSVELSDRTIPLAPFSVLPDPAMDLVDPTHTFPVQHDPSMPRLRATVVPSRGTNSIVSLGLNRAGVALSSGTVAIMTSGWGIVNDSDQLLLPFPPVGTGRVELCGEEFIACCLRAGTCYLIPTNVHGRGHSAPRAIPAIAYPHDIDTDTANHYVQGFSAGEIQISCHGEDHAAIPVLVFAWAGGVVDIYSCELLHPLKSCIPACEEQILQELIDQRCLSQVLEVLGKMDQDPNHHLHQDETWTAIRKEMEQHDESLVPATVNDMSRMPILRETLLKLALVEMD